MAKSEQMTPDRLAAIKARAEAATPGPWVVELPEWGECDGIRSKNGTQILNAGSCIPDPKTAVDYGGTVHDWKEEPYDYGVYKQDDSTFIAHAREDVPALLTEVERLRAEVARLRVENQQLCRQIDWLANTLEVESPYCDECEFRDERYPDYGENVTWCAHAPDGTCDSCDQSWRMEARKATRENPGESGNVPENQGEE